MMTATEWWTVKEGSTDHSEVIRMSNDVHKMPAVTKTAFNCPHCDAYAEQSWFPLAAYRPGKAHWTPYERNSNIPKAHQFIEKRVIPRSHLADYDSSAMHEFTKKFSQEDKFKEDVLAKKAVLSLSFGPLEKNLQSRAIYNIYVSRCSHCRELAVWVNEKMAYPPETLGVRPNQDLPDDIKNLFDEARQIATASPRSAAALLRLCIERLCKHLGTKGENLSEDISNLVKQGLTPELQKMLDSVRVIGNHAVHPGKLDEDDSKERVLALFEIVNLIAERMISEPQKINKIYGSLPKDDLKRIERRDQGKRRK